MDCSPPGSSVPGILQARILEWVAISFSRGSSQPRNRTPVSCIAGKFFTNWATFISSVQFSRSVVSDRYWLFLCACSVAQWCLTLQPHGLEPYRLFCSWDFPGKNTGVGSHFLLQRIFLTQGLNPSLLHWQADSLPLNQTFATIKHIRTQTRKTILKPIHFSVSVNSLILD